MRLRIAGEPFRHAAYSWPASGNFGVVDGMRDHSGIRDGVGFPYVENESSSLPASPRQRIDCRENCEDGETGVVGIVYETTGAICAPRVGTGEDNLDGPRKWLE
jgi:hypothetical protein